MATVLALIGYTVERKLVTLLDGTTIGPAVCAADPDDCCDPGSGPPDPPVPPPGPVIIPGCSHEYPGTIYGTWTNFSGDCTCFIGSFPLYHNGTAWVGTFRNCAGPITVTVTPGTLPIWDFTFTSGSYTLSEQMPLPIAFCGSLPSAVVVSISGACTGTATIAFSV